MHIEKNKWLAFVKLKNICQAWIYLKHTKNEFLANTVKNWKNLYFEEIENWKKLPFYGWEAQELQTSS